MTAYHIAISLPVAMSISTLTTTLAQQFLPLTECCAGNRLVTVQPQLVQSLEHPFARNRDSLL